MNEEEIQHKQELIEALKRRLRERELQAAHFGVSADPIILTEIKDIKKQMVAIEQELDNTQKTSDIVSDTKATRRGCSLSLQIVFIFAWVLVGGNLALRSASPGNQTDYTEIVWLFIWLAVLVIAVLVLVYNLLQMRKRKVERIK